MDEFAMMLMTASREQIKAYHYKVKAEAYAEGVAYGKRMAEIAVGEAIGVDLRGN
jgi:hypothetical protein